jgi:hypothetical protein
MPAWSAGPVTVKPASSASVTTKVAAPGCTGTYRIHVVAKSATGASATTTVSFTQFLKVRNH